MHIKVTRKSTEKALRLFYAQEPTLEIPEGETEIPEGESLEEVEEAAYALLRSHVRAIDETEDDLLLIYLEAALDYMEQLTNRILGESDVIVYLDAEDLKRPFTLHKINDVSTLWKLEYRSKDADDKPSYFEQYKLFEAEYENEILNEKITGLDDYHFAVEQNGVNNIDLNLLFEEVTNITAVSVQFQKRGADGSYGTIPGVADSSYTGAEVQRSIEIMSSTAVEPATPVDWTEGMYRVRVQVTDDGVQTTSHLYFTVHNGTDFDNVIITDRYPCYMDLREYKSAIGEDCSTHEEDFARAYITAGTDLMAVPKQYKQAALLLVGHYYNQREAENIGGITTEVKEGVHRLLQSVRHY